MVPISKLANVVVFGFGIVFITRITLNLLRNREQRLARIAERHATKSWEGEGGSVMGVNPPVFEPATK